jgi:hypothetical protein
MGKHLSLPVPGVFWGVKKRSWIEGMVRSLLVRERFYREELSASPYVKKVANSALVRNGLVY